MITFQKDSLIITIPTENAVEDWMDLITEIGGIFTMLNSENMPNRGGLYNLAVLLQALVPDFVTALRMTNDTDDAATPKTHTPPLGAMLNDLQRLGEENGRLRERLRIMEEQASTTDDEKKPRTGSAKRTA